MSDLDWPEGFEDRIYETVAALEVLPLTDRGLKELRFRFQEVVNSFIVQGILGPYATVEEPIQQSNGDWTLLIVDSTAGRQHVQVTIGNAAHYRSPASKRLRKLQSRDAKRKMDLIRDKL